MTTTVIDTTSLKFWKGTAIGLAILSALLLTALGVQLYYSVYRTLGQNHTAKKPEQLSMIDQPAQNSPQYDLDALNDIFTAGNPWEQLNRLHQQMNQLFQESFGQSTQQWPTVAAFSSPSMDLREQENDYVLRLDMPGTDKNSIKVNIEGRVLTITGNRTAVSEAKENKAVRTERSMAQFIRTIHLPAMVKADAIDAHYDNGVLTVKLPKEKSGSFGKSVPIR